MHEPPPVSPAFPAVTPSLGGINLDQIAADLARKQAASPRKPAESGPAKYELDSSRTISEAAFNAALDAYMEGLKAANKMNLASALSQAGHLLQHNRWQCTTPNPLQKELIERDSDLLPYLREHLREPMLFLVVVVDAARQSAESDTPYTEEEKLKEILRERPALARLQRLFKTRILYD